MRLPDFLGIGALKAGSTLLYTLLADHPQVYMAPHRKEVRFFEENWHRGADWYGRLFEGAGDRVCGEFSPQYAFDPAAAERIRQTVPDVRLLMVLRDPVDRAWSQYKHAVVETGFEGDFSAFLETFEHAIGFGCYREQLERYLDRFAREQLLVVLFEDLVADPVAVAQQAYHHLGVDPGHRPPHAGARVNPSRVPRFPRLYVRARRSLRWLHQHDMSWVVDGLRRVGGKRVFESRGPGGGFPPPNEAQKARLDAVYRPQRPWLSDLLDRDLDTVWRA